MSNVEDEFAGIVAVFERITANALARARPLMVAPYMHLNRDKTVAVATDYFWNDDMTECPRGVKVQLLGKSGVAVYGQWNGTDDFWVAWAPLPKRRPK